MDSKLWVNKFKQVHLTQKKISFIFKNDNTHALKEYMFELTNEFYGKLSEQFKNFINADKNVKFQIFLLKWLIKLIYFSAWRKN